MAIACIIRDAKASRKTTCFLHGNLDVAKRIGLVGRMPSKNTTWRIYSRMPESYLYEIHMRVAEEIEVRYVAVGDSTGISKSWFDFWINKIR